MRWDIPFVRRRRHEHDAGRRLLTIEGDYSLHVIQSRRLHHELISSDVQGWFEHVWHVNPLTGADPDEPEPSSIGPPRTVEVAPGHTFVEGHVGLTTVLRSLPALNLLLAQGALLLRLTRIIRKDRISMIRVGDPYYLGILGLLLARLHHRPLVVKIAANYDAIHHVTGKPAYPRLLRSRRIEKTIECAVLRRADLVTAANENNLAYALGNGARRNRATVFRYGSWVDPSHFAPPDHEPDFLPSLGLSGRTVAVMVGRLEPVKHPEDALTAVAVARRAGEDVCLLAVGDGSMRSQLERAAADHGIADAVVFAGARNQDEVRAAMRGASVILAPLAGRALVEAALSGRPIVAYDVEWHGELIESGETGILVPYRDADAMGAALAELARDPDRADRLGAAARLRCLEMMSPDVLAAHERAVYARVLERR
ncbi:MAG: glycosyltransferase family 4 protein [Actinomycetota bacterium]|nr:glycosyltransferase family 4 protein [Actinomycetota bacterium]